MERTNEVRVNDKVEESLDKSVSNLKNMVKNNNLRKIDTREESLRIKVSNLKKTELTSNLLENDRKEKYLRHFLLCQKRKNIEILNNQREPNKRRKMDIDGSLTRQDIEILDDSKKLNKRTMNDHDNFSNSQDIEIIVELINQNNQMMNNSGSSIKSQYAQSNITFDESYKNHKKHLQGKLKKKEEFVESKNSKLQSEQELQPNTTESFSISEKITTNAKNILPVVLSKAINIKCIKVIDKFEPEQIEKWIENFLNNFNLKLNFNWGLNKLNKTVVGINQLTSFFSVIDKDNTNLKFNKDCVILECLIPEFIPLIYYININKNKYRNWRNDEETFRNNCDILANKMNNWIKEFKVNLKSAFK